MSEASKSSSHWTDHPLSVSQVQAGLGYLSKFPAEVRDRIYAFTLTADSGCIIENVDEDSQEFFLTPNGGMGSVPPPQSQGGRKVIRLYQYLKDRADNWASIPCASITRVSKAVHLESIAHLYDRNCFDFRLYPCVWEWFESIGPRNAANVTNIEIYFHPAFGEPDQPLCKILNGAPRLKRAHLYGQMRRDCYTPGGRLDKIMPFFAALLRALEDHPTLEQLRSHSPGAYRFGEFSQSDDLGEWEGVDLSLTAADWRDERDGQIRRLEEIKGLSAEIATLGHESSPSSIDDEEVLKASEILMRTHSQHHSPETDG